MRVIRYAFELARKSKKHLTSATKSNGIIFTMPFWDQCFHEIAAKYPDVRTDQYHIDILTAHSCGIPIGSTSSLGRISSATSCRTGTCGCRIDWHRAFRQPESREGISVDV